MDRIWKQQALLHPFLITAAVALALRKCIRNYRFFTSITDEEIFAFCRNEPAPEAPTLPEIPIRGAD